MKVMESVQKHVKSAQKNVCIFDYKSVNLAL